MTPRPYVRRIQPELDLTASRLTSHTSGWPLNTRGVWSKSMQLQKKKKENLHGRSLRLVKSRGSSVSSFENVVQVVRVPVRVLSRILVKIVEEYSNNTTVFVRNDKFANRRLSSSTRERFFPFFFVVALLSHLEPYHRMPWNLSYRCRINENKISLYIFVLLLQSSPCLSFVPNHLSRYRTVSSARQASRFDPEFFPEEKLPDSSRWLELSLSPFLSSQISSPISQV